MEGTERHSVAAAQREANEVFSKMQQVVEANAKEGVVELDVIKIAREAGLEGIDEEVLKELQLPRLVPCHPWLPWHIWWPWRPLWCWWWHWRYPWYRWCCPWWWYRCHWYPYPL